MFFLPDKFISVATEEHLPCLSFPFPYYCSDFFLLKRKLKWELQERERQLLRSYAHSDLLRHWWQILCCNSFPELNHRVWNEISANVFFCFLYSLGFPRAHSMISGLEDVSVSSKIISYGNIFCFYETCNYHALWKQILDYRKKYLYALCQWHLRCSVH